MLRPALVVLVLGLAACAAACGPEPEPSFGDPSGIAGRKIPNDGNEAPSPGTSPGDAGATSSGGTTDPFSPAPAAPTQTAKAAHAAKGQTAILPTLACGSCHGGSGPGPSWAIAGYVEAKGAGANGAIVAVMDGTTRLAAAKTDSDGFFWVAGTPVAKGNVSVKLTKVAKMGTTLSTGGNNCNSSSCHTGSAGTIQVE